jgi:hypothetical protein
MCEAWNKRISEQASLGKKGDPISKITRTKKAGGGAQVIECLLKKHEFKPQYCQKNVEEWINEYMSGWMHKLDW